MTSNSQIDPSVSIIMSCYNSKSYLTNAIESILNQSYQNFEFIIINDGSTNETSTILESYANNSKIKIINRHNHGLTPSLNHGLSIAKGKWIARMDDDDISDSNRLLEQVKFLKSNPEVVLLGTGCQRIDAKDNPLGKPITYPTNHQNLVNLLVKHKPFFPHASAIFNRITALKLGGYCERFQRAQDYDLWLRFCRIGKISCLQEPYTKLRIHETSITNTDGRKLQNLYAHLALFRYFCVKKGIADPLHLQEEIFEIFLHEFRLQCEKRKGLIRFSDSIKKDGLLSIDFWKVVIYKIRFQLLGNPIPESLLKATTIRTLLREQ